MLVLELVSFVNPDFAAVDSFLEADDFVGDDALLAQGFPFLLQFLHSHFAACQLLQVLADFDCTVDVLFDVLGNIELVLLALVDHLGDLGHVHTGLQEPVELLNPSLELFGLAILQAFKVFLNSELHFVVRDDDLAAGAEPVVRQVVWKHHEEPGLREVVVHVMEQIQSLGVHSLAGGQTYDKV